MIDDADFTAAAAPDKGKFSAMGRGTAFWSDRTQKIWILLLPAPIQCDIHLRARQMIELSQLQDMFDSITNDAGWDMSKPMLWGYFFTDRQRAKLDSALVALEQQGFTYVDIFIPQLEKGEEDYFFLHVTRVDTHTPESLFEQNARLYAFAAEHQLGSYDGMDVGPVAQA